MAPDVTDFYESTASYGAAVALAALPDGIGRQNGRTRGQVEGRGPLAVLAYSLGRWPKCAKGGNATRRNLDDRLTVL